MISTTKMYIRKKKTLTHNVDKFSKALNALQYKTFMQKMHTHAKDAYFDPESVTSV